jgi:hypothetical protein
MPAHRVVKVQPHEFLPSELYKCKWPASSPSHFKAGEKVPIATQQEVGWGWEGTVSLGTIPLHYANGLFTFTIFTCLIYVRKL